MAKCKFCGNRKPGGAERCWYCGQSLVDASLRESQHAAHQRATAADTDPMSDVLRTAGLVDEEPELSGRRRRRSSRKGARMPVGQGAAAANAADVRFRERAGGERNRSQPIWIMYHLLLLVIIYFLLLLFLVGGNVPWPVVWEYFRTRF